MSDFTKPDIEKPGRYELALNAGSFEYIKSGKQTVEGRAGTADISNDPNKNYANYKPGDIITFTNNTTGESIEVVVEKINWYANLDEMFKAVGMNNAVPNAETLEDGYNDYYSIPTYQDRIKQFGIWAIKIQLKTQDAE